MPVYPYECIECQHRFEILASLKEAYSENFCPSCPKCGSEINRRLISRTSFSLKGGGWYKDGYNSKTVKSEK